MNKQSKKGKKEAILLVGSSERDANMYWATKFKQLDPFTLIEIDGKKFLITKELEFDRAKEQAKVDEVVNLREYGEERGIKNIKTDEIIPLFLKDLGINTVIVPEHSSYKLGKLLENKGFCVKIKNEPFFEQRNIKTEQEIEYITKVQRATEDVLDKTLDIIKKSEIKNGLLYYFEKPLTSEYLRNFIRIELLKRNCWCEADVIVSCGEQTSMPHMYGTEQLIANSPIIIDIFPRHLETKYWADMTRTVFKGKASNEFKRLYNTVLEAQKIGIEMIKPGVDVFFIHQAVESYFESHGYETDKINKPMKGFFHGTGHGVGLNIHEYPKLRSKDRKGTWILEEGNVITIEPGLYYPKKEPDSPYPEIGGVRIEDLLVVTKNGYRNLTKFPKDLESMQL